MKLTDTEQGDMRKRAVEVLADTTREITERKQAEQALRESEHRHRFLVQLGDWLRDLADPKAVMAVAAEMLGAHLGVGRAGYGEIDAAQQYISIEGDWTTGDMPSFAGRHYLDAFGPELIAEYQAGRTIQLDDALADQRAAGDGTSGQEIAAFAAIDTRAGIGVPLIKNGRWVAVFFVHQSGPRTWKSDEVALVEDVAERTWEAVERARAEAALRKSEERYRTLFNSIDEGFCVIEMLFDDSGKPVDYLFVEVNDAFEKQTGLKDAQGKTMRQLAPNHEDNWFEIYGKVAVTGEPVRFVNQARLLHRWFELYAFRFGPSESRRVAVIFKDITERKRAEEQERESMARLRRTLDIETVGVIYWSLEGVIVGANDAFLRMTDHSLEEAVGLSWQDLTPEEFVPASEHALWELRKRGEITPYEKRYYRKDGSTWWGLFAARRLSDDEFVEFVLDITERKQAEEVRRKRELEQTLDEQLAKERRRLGRELHDGLRQELVGIQMLSSSLTRKLEGRGAPEAALMREFSELVAGANVQVRELINGLVPGKIEADSLLPALERAAANIERWYGLLCSVSWRHQVSLPDDATADHLFHIAQEAMTNAAKHAKASQIDVCLVVAGETLVLEVHDNGIGLPDNFEKRGGMGLGNLRTRAELIGAQLDFKSKEDTGTVVSCRLSL